MQHLERLITKTDVSVVFEHSIGYISDNAAKMTDTLTGTGVKKKYTVLVVADNFDKKLHAL